MLLQTNSYIVPKEKRSDHARLMRRFKQVLGKLGCDMFEIYEQVGANWNGSDTSGRYVQIMRFRDRKHQVAVQNAERNDPAAQALIAEFCDLVNFPYQQQQGFFAVGFYNSVLPVATTRGPSAAPEADEPLDDVEAGEAIVEAEDHVSAHEPHAEDGVAIEPVAEMIDAQIVTEAHDVPSDPESLESVEEIEEFESAAAEEEPLAESPIAESTEETPVESVEEVSDSIDGESGGSESESVQPEEIIAEHPTAEPAEAAEEYHFGVDEVPKPPVDEPPLSDAELMEEPLETAEPATEEVAEEASSAEQVTEEGAAEQPDEMVEEVTETAEAEAATEELMVEEPGEESTELPVAPTPEHGASSIADTHHAEPVEESPEPVQEERPSLFRRRSRG